MENKWKYARKNLQEDVPADMDASHIERVAWVDGDLHLYADALYAPNDMEDTVYLEDCLLVLRQAAVQACGAEAVPECERTPALAVREAEMQAAFGGAYITYEEFLRNGCEVQELFYDWEQKTLSIIGYNNIHGGNVVPWCSVRFGFRSMDCYWNGEVSRAAYEGRGF